MPKIPVCAIVLLITNKECETITKRIYWSDIVECEDQLFDDIEALEAVALQDPELFITYWTSDYELVNVEVTDELEITFTELDFYDDNGEEVRVTKTEKFSYSYSKQLAVLV